MSSGPEAQPLTPGDTLAKLPAQLSADDLDARITGTVRLTARSQRFAEELAAGATVVSAARRSGLSTKCGAPYKHAAQPAVAELVALLRERARRRAAVTVEAQIVRFQGLASKAEEAGELSVAVAAEDKVSKLAGLYPKDSPVIVGGAPVQIIVHTGLPQRDGETVLVNRALPSGESALAEVPQACVDPGDTGSRGEVTTQARERP